MADRITKTQRSQIMAAVKSKNTTPELAVRKAVRAIGIGYSIHSAKLPGCPNIVMPKRRQAIMVHGCWWHGHTCMHGARVPKSNTAYWTAKINGNKTRDRRMLRALRRLGWKVLVVWECQIREVEKLKVRLRRFLS